MTKKARGPAAYSDKTKRHKPKSANAQSASQKTGSQKSKAKKAKAKKARPKKKSVPRVADPSDTDDAEVRFIQPYEAVKVYLCPGCNRDIPVGMGHMVAIPPDAPDLRRHWHRGCWNNRDSRF
jgi:hypothetical protein